MRAGLGDKSKKDRTGASNAYHYEVAKIESKKQDANTSPAVVNRPKLPQPNERSLLLRDVLKVYNRLRAEQVARKESGRGRQDTQTDVELRVE